MFILIDGGLAGLGQGAGKATYEAIANESKFIIAEEESRSEDKKESELVTNEDGSQTRVAKQSRGPKRDQGRLDEASQNLAYAESMLAKELEGMRMGEQQQITGKEALTKKENEAAVEKNQQRLA